MGYAVFESPIRVGLQRAICSNNDASVNVSTPNATHVEEVQGCLADLAGDNGIVDVNDLLFLIAAWGSSDSPADITGPDSFPDGTVDIADLLQLIAAWGPC